MLKRTPYLLALLGWLALLVGCIYVLVRVLGGTRSFETVGDGGIRFNHQVGALAWIILALAGGLALIASWLLTRSEGVPWRRRDRHSRARLAILKVARWR